MDEHVDVEWLESKIKSTPAGVGISKFLGVEVQPALAKGENYASKMIRIKIAASLDNGQRKTISIILKRMIDITDPEAEFAVTLYQLFNSEYDVYANILPHIEEALRGVDAEESRFWADCYAHIPSKDIYFQDLNDFGYKVADRKKGLDLDHSELMLRTLGRFHAASMVCIDKGKYDASKLRPYFMTLNDDNLRRSLSPSFYLMCSVMHSDWGPEWQDLAEKMGKLPDIIFEKMSDTYVFDPSRINVMNHGDFWVSNCMFKYDRSGKPVSIRFVDFQICHYNSYAWDLVYFFYTSVDTDLKAKYLDRLLSSYCDSFKRTLSALGSSLPSPSLQHARSELARLAPAAITSSICVRPVIMCESEENVLQPDEIMTEHKGADAKKILLFKNPVLTKILKVDLKETFYHLDF